VILARLSEKCARTALFVAVLVSASTLSAHAQTLYGSIVGNVRDTSGAAVPGATVTIKEKGTGLERTTVSNETGSYSFTNVLQGTYDVKVSLQGFKEFVQTDVPVTIGQISRVDPSLELGALTETITVASDAQLLQTDKATVSTEIKSKELTSMPLNQFRNYQALINLVPGASPAAFSNAETDTPSRSLSTWVNGQSSYVNSTRTDGATNVNIWLPNHQMLVSSAETIETVNISTNSFDAEQGMAGGAAVTVITKSGTNEFRGSAFEFYNSDKLNANTYYFGGNRPQGKPDKPPVTRNIFGGTLGGPIVKNRLFFFGSMEGYKSKQTVNQFFNVPDARLRAGDFSQALNTNGSVQVIYDPLTGNPDGSGRTPFPNNQIPANRLNPVALQLLGFYPNPNVAGTGAGGLTSNYFRPEERTTDRYNYDGKVNFNRTAAHQIWGKFSYLDAVVDDRTYFLMPDPVGSGDGGVTAVYQATAGQTWTLNNSTVWDMTFGFSRQKQDVLGPDADDGNYGIQTLGIRGTNDQSDIGGTADERYAGIPEFRTGFTNLGNYEGWMPIFRDERTYSFNTNVSKIVGRHDLRAGYSVNFLWLNHWQPEIDNPRGRFDFTTRNVTSLNGGQANNFYNNYAAFLLGMPGTISKSVQVEEMTGREWQHGLFIRDRWTPTDKLTVDLGLRWEYYPIMTRADRGLERVDLQTLNVLVGGRGGNPENVGLEAAWDNFAPRVGLIYRFNENTVFRTGYGITYNAMPWARPLRGQYPAMIGALFQNASVWQPFGSLSTGIPLIPEPNIDSGQFPLPNTVRTRTPEVGNVDRARVQSWNVAVERRLPWDLAIDVAYVANRSDGGYADLDINAPAVVGGGNASRPYFVSNGRNLRLDLWGQRLKTRYHSLQVALNRPFTGGLLLKGAYTLGKAKNFGTDDDGWTGLAFNTPSLIDRNYSNAGYDRRHNFQLGFVYQMPWQSGQGGNPLKVIINDWQLNGVLAMFSGRPFTVTGSAGAFDTPENLALANQVADLKHVGEIGGSGLYYDPSSFVGAPARTIGNTERNQFYGPGGFNLDASLFRGFPIGGTRRIEFRLEASNLTNSPIFNPPVSGDITNANFMRITGLQSGYDTRQIRLGLRFQF
jgi:hypothetical protein